MLDDHENELFENTKQDVADIVCFLIEAGVHPALLFAGMMSIITEAITTEGFWGDETPGFEEIRGFGNMMWRLQEKAFAELAAGSSARSTSSTL